MNNSVGVGSRCATWHFVASGNRKRKDCDIVSVSSPRRNHHLFCKPKDHSSCTDGSRVSTKQCSIGSSQMRMATSEAADVVVAVVFGQRIPKVTAKSWFGSPNMPTHERKTKKTRVQKSKQAVLCRQQIVRRHFDRTGTFLALSTVPSKRSLMLPLCVPSVVSKRQTNCSF